MISTDLAAAYQQPAEDVIAALSGDAERGLTTEEARRRLAQYGRNELQAEAPISAWRKFLAQFQDVLIILLLIAAAISLVVWLYERDEPLPFEALVIFAIVLLNGILGFVQEERAERSVAVLRAMAAAEASVLRDGQLQRVPATDLVPGDIIAIEEGDTLPADGRLIRSVALQIAEASLTGESLPVSKNTAPLADEVGIGDRRNSVFSGTTATYGRGRAVLTATGMQTEMGKIAGLLHQTESDPTPLQQELDRTGKLLGIVAGSRTTTTICEPVTHAPQPGHGRARRPRGGHRPAGAGDAGCGGRLRRYCRGDRRGGGPASGRSDRDGDARVRWSAALDARQCRRQGASGRAGAAAVGTPASRYGSRRSGRVESAHWDASTPSQCADSRRWLLRPLVGTHLLAGQHIVDRRVGLARHHDLGDCALVERSA